MVLYSKQQRSRDIGIAWYLLDYTETLGKV